MPVENVLNLLQGALILGGSAMLREREVRNRLAEYLLGETSLRDFSSWLYGQSWGMEANGTDRHTQDFVNAILGRLAEQSSAGFPESVLHAALLGLASTITVQEEWPEHRTESSARVVVSPSVPVAS
jgi:hypothetical protein